jgi:FtsP/CotA-like multicopper oxidase with cupredoxin domain
MLRFAIAFVRVLRRLRSFFAFRGAPDRVQRHGERAEDVAMLGGYQEMEVDFTADQSGLLLFHCHMQLHMDYGFMTLFDTVSSIWRSERGLVPRSAP